MNSMELVIKFKNLLYASYDRHVKINEEMYSRNSELKNLAKAHLNEIESLESDIVSVEVSLQNEIERTRNEYNENERAYNERKAYYEKCKKEYESLNSDQSLSLDKYQRILEKTKAAVELIVSYANEPSEHDLIKESKGLVSHEIIASLEVLRKNYPKDCVKKINISSPTNYGRPMLKSNDTLEKLVDLFGHQYNQIYYKILDYGYSSLIFRSQKLKEVIIEFRVLFDIAANIEYCIDELVQIGKMKVSRLLDEKREKMVAAYDKIGLSPESFAVVEAALRREANAKISDIKKRINILQNKKDDEQTLELKSAIINENKQLHNEEATNLFELLEEELRPDEIKKYLSMTSFIESCESYSDYRCPEEFAENVVLGNISFDYYNDPKISQFNNITDVVDEFIEKNNLKLKKVDGHYIFEIPFVIDWSDFKGISFIYDQFDYDKIKSAYQSVLFHLFADIRPKSTIFTMIDGILPAGTFASFPSFVKVGEAKFINQKIYNNFDEIEELFSDMRTQVEQATAGFRYDSIVDANRTLVNKKLMNIIALAAVENGVISDDAAEILSDIVSGGKNVGYYCISLSDSCELIDRIYKDRYCGITVRTDEEGFYAEYENETFALDLFMNPGCDEYSVISERVAECYESATKFGSFSFIDSKIFEPLGQNTKAISNISVKIAIDIDDQICNFILDNQNINYFILGLPRMGKSRFIHEVITNIIRKYSPEDVNLYVMSYKAVGTEMRIFSKFDIPHFKMINLSRSGYAFLNFFLWLRKEQNRRDDIFNNNPSNKSFDNYIDYMKFYCSGSPFADQMEYLPRIVVIVDEIQEVLSDETILKEFSTVYNSIVATASGFGIHMIFTTQMLNNITGESKIKIDTLQSFSKVIFNCLPGDLNALVSSSNNVQSLMDDTPGHAFMIGGSRNMMKEIYVPLYNFDDQEYAEIKNICTYYEGKKCDTLVVKENMFDGINNIYSQFIDDPTEIVLDNDIKVGEPIAFNSEEITKIELSDPAHDNIMLLGDDMSKSINTGIYLSLLGHLITSGKYKHSEVIFVNCGELKQNDIILNTFKKLDKTLSECGADTKFLKYITCGNIKEQLNKLVADYAGIISTDRTNCPDVYIFLYGIHNTNALEDFYGRLNKINENYKRFIHIIVWANQRAAMEDFMKKTAMEDAFKYKLAFSNNEDDNCFVLGRKEDMLNGIAKMKPLGYEEESCFVPYNFGKLYQPDNMRDPVNQYINALNQVLLKRR